MAKTLSTMPALQSKAPSFSLLDVTTNTHFTLEMDPTLKATVIMFICNHCPFVKHINKALTKLANDYINKKVRFIAINANDIEAYPADAPLEMIKTAQEEHYPFPYLFDDTQDVAKAYQAACTPDFFIYDNQLRLAYRGQLDDSRPGNAIPVTGNDLRKALDCLINDKPLTDEQKPSMGCNIKWKS